MASSYVDSKTEIGSIFGTGSNAAYMERCSKIPKLADQHFPDDAFMAINCEYGAFDNSQRVLPFTDYDAEIDRASPRPGQQRYEKMVAGFYLGEIFRLILLDLHNRKAIFDGQNSSELNEPYVLDCCFLATIESDDSGDLRTAKETFEKTLSITPSPSELRFCYDLAHMISLRSARLYACGIAAIMKKRGLESCHVAVDGSVFNKYPCFPERAIGALREILEWPANNPDPIQLIPAVDGSSVGAAVIALLISRSEQS
jgi:hexokinase